MNSTHFLLLVLLELSCGYGFSLKLGPDGEDTACTTDGCYPETQGFTRPRSLKVDEFNEETHKDLDSNVHSDGEDTACTTDGCYPETQGFTRPRSLKVDEFNEETHKDLDSNVHSDGEDTACTTDGCYPETQGFTRPRSLKVDEFNEETHKDLDSNVHSDEKGEFAFIEIGSMLSKVCRSVSGAISTANGYFNRTVYNKTANMTNNFTEKVREVFHEELYGFFEVMTQRFGDLLFSPGNAYIVCLCLVP